MPPRLLIIADDLTGANDTGVQFAKQGIPVLVSIRPDQCLRAFADDCQVLVANTESRHLSSHEAYQRVYQIAQQGIQLGIPQFYKKTDSTLRGNLGSEFEALQDATLDATGERELFFAPAYPKLQRTTRNGVQFVHGIALHQSSFANDPFNPIQADSIAKLLANQTTKSIRILDAETDADLRRIADQYKDKPLLAGSAGLAEFLPAAMQIATSLVAPITLSTPMLVVNGSLHETSLRQIAHAANNGWTVIEFNSETSVAQVIEAIHTNPHVALTTTAKRQDEQANRLANLFAKIQQQIAIPTIAIFGGDTLAAIAEACDWRAFRPLTEFVSGVPLVQVCEADSFLLITKAGGFGAEDFLLLF